MPSSIRCRLQGHDPDACNVCRRCGDESGAAHSWGEEPRERPCYRRERCGRCGQEREQPEHEWDSIGSGLKCRRCGLSI